MKSNEWIPSARALLSCIIRRIKIVESIVGRHGTTGDDHLRWLMNKFKKKYANGTVK